MADMDNFRPHRPTFVSTLIVVVVLVVLYHVFWGRKKG